MKRKAEPLADRVTATALRVDRSWIAALLGDMVAKHLSRTGPVPAPAAWPETMPTSAEAGTGASSAKPRRRRSSRSELNTKRVNSAITSAWSSGLRYNTKRWNKLEFVLKRIALNEEAGRATRVASLLGATYDEDTGDRLDAHDINGMVERGHITLED